MRRFKQRDISDCGAACFAFICDHYRLRLPIARLRQELGTNQAGTSAAALVHAARRLGFSAKGVKGPPEALGAAPLPAIAHCLTERKLTHYVVLVAWSSRRARVMDPATGRVERWSPQQFCATWTGILVLLTPAAEFKTGDRTLPPWRRFGELLRPQRALLIQVGMGALVSTVLGLGTSVYVQKIVDAVIPDGNRPLLNLLGLAMLALVCFRLVLGGCQSMLSLRIAQRIDAALIAGYYRHLLRLPQPFFDAMRVGEITSRVGDAVKIRNFLNTTLVGLVLNPLIILFSLVAMFWWSWQLALVSLALLPAYALIYAGVDRVNRGLQRRLMERAADFDAQLVESLNAQPVIRSFGLESLDSVRVERKLVRLLRTTWSAGIATLVGGTAVNAATQIHTVVLLWLGAGLVLRAEISPGQLMSCYSLAGYLAGPVTTLIGMNGAIRDTLIAMDRLFEIMDLELEPDQGTHDLRDVGPREIRLEDVVFRHPGRPHGLERLALIFPAGQISVLTGPSGCGKSTVLALIQRLYPLDSGRILLGEVDLRYVRLASLRHWLAVVPQQTRLLTGTVLENLVPGDHEPDLPRLIGLCRKVGILEFIEQLPQGFLTHLTENGANLSGGQRQRLALVRALYRDAPCLLLDEPTSALDCATAGQFVATLRALRAAGRTIIVATHAPELMAVADRRYDLAEGRLMPAAPAIPAAS